MAYNLLLTSEAKQQINRLVKKFGKPFANQLFKALQTLKENLSHPGLRVHAFRGWRGWMEAYINKRDRLIFRVKDDITLEVGWIGTHAELDKQFFATSLHKADCVPDTVPAAGINLS